MNYGELRRKICAWDRAGLSHATIARNLGLHPKEVREIAMKKTHWAPPPEMIAEECAKIRARWTDADWEKACRLMR